MTVHRVVRLNLPGENNVLLFGGNLERVVMPLPAKLTGQNFNEAAVGLHEVVVYEACPMHAHLHTAVNHSIITHIDEGIVL